jgi:hypothetical protein
MLLVAACLWLAIAPPDNNYQQATAQLDEALEAVGSGASESSITALREALERMVSFPDELPKDAFALEKLSKARLSLVWLLLEIDQAAAATEMDEAIRSARGIALPVRSFGPDVFRLYETRRDALAAQGMATIDVQCQVPCEVVIGERRSPAPSDPLYLGSYRVWVGYRGDSAEWESFHVVLDTAGETKTIVFETKASIPEPQTEFQSEVALVTKPQTEDRPVTLPIRDQRIRILPRWVEILSLSAGAGLAIAGGILLSYNGKCQGGGDPSTPEGCPNVYNNTAAGYAMIATGVGVFAIAGPMLAVDEVRVGRAKGRTAMLSWTFKF